MLIVTDLDGKSEMLTEITGASVTEEVNGDFSFSFGCIQTDKNRHSFPLLQEESTIELNGHEFKVKKLTEVHNRKSVFASHIFFDLIGHRKHEIFGGTKTLDEFANYSLFGSGWTFENVDVIGSVLIPNFGDDNAVALIRKICEYFKCEVKIEPGKHLKFCKQVGTETDEQFRYGHNIKTLKRNVNTDNLYTVIKGYGGDGLEVTYRSPMADIYGERYANPVRDDRYTVAESLIERLKQELNDVPDISIDVEAANLDFETELGMRLWLIHEKIGIDFKTRIIAMKWFPFTRQSPVVTISNKKRTFTDLLTETRVDIKENQKETRSKIEQTNERIGLEVVRIDESIATLEIEADNITLSVQSLDQRMGSAESTLSVQAGMISSKVSYGDVMSAIEQSPETIKLSASRIELSGITEVAHTLRIGTNNPQSGTRTIEMDDWSNITAHSDYSSMELYSAGYIYLDAHIKLGQGLFGGFKKNIDFSNVNLVNMPDVPNANNAYYLNGNSASSFVKTSQGISISLNSAGTMSVTTSSGKTATFFPDSWTG
ncbi:phage tail protein [Mesobacillus subterraneus]|uniref:phage tail protein n=1 Tax=Mesobacillus subterraneus TaxID=285983 RepID=UPI00203DA7BF|nr:phage tail protein [Mesobacillus subterraneus]MCM3573270.1 phage tail protein [Mesobacillus subterraneus]